MDSIGIIAIRDFKENKPTRKEAGMRLNKKISLCIVPLIFVVMLFSACNVLFNSPSYEEWAETVEQFYDDNKETLNEFVELCFENGIDVIYNTESPKEGDACTVIESYYVYSYEPLEEDVINELAAFFVLFKEYEVHDISISEDSFAGVSFGMGGFGYSIGLKYTTEIKTIEEIKKANFYREVWYIDNHWYIGYGD